MALVTLQDLTDAATDADTLEHFVNDPASPGTVTTRLGTSLKSLAKIQADVLAAAAVPIWAYISGLSAGGSEGTAGVVRSSGGITVSKGGTGSYTVFHNSFTENTRVVATPYGDSSVGACIEQRTAGTRFVTLVIKNSAGTAVDLLFTLLTFPQML